MLQKPQTKFGYARRIFALPVLFTIAFAYMVNAKNKEITETNIEIEKAVAEIKRDTLSPKSEADQIVKLQQEKIAKASEKLKIQSEKLKTLSEKSKEKAAELQKIAKEKGEKSYDFELKAKELKQLSGEMDKIARDKQYLSDFDELLAKRDKILSDKDVKVILKDMSFKRVFPDGDNYKITVDGENIDIDKLFDSNEFKDLDLSEDKIKIIKEKFSSPEFKEKIGKINKFYIKGKDINTNSEELKKLGYSFFNESSNFPKKELTKKEKRKLDKLNKERAEAEKKLQEIRKQQRELQGNPWILNVDAHAPKVSYSATSSYTEIPTPPKTRIISTGGAFKSNVRDMIDSNSESTIKIFIDDKASSNEEMKNLDPSKIESITVNKTKSTGKSSGEIYIKTRK